MLETEHELLIFVALPGVDPESGRGRASRAGYWSSAATAILPAELRNARIHRLELPQGRFERRIALPTGRYAVSRFATNGCVGLRLAKVRVRDGHVP